MSKRKKSGPKIVGQWVGHPAKLIRVLRELSLTARRILDSLEIEHCRRGGRENGQLIATYTHLALVCNVTRRSIPNGLRELESAGLIKKARQGRRSYADLRVPSMYRLTYLSTFHDGKWTEPTHDWKQKAGAMRDTGTGEMRDTGYPQKPVQKVTPREPESRGKEGHSYLDLGVEGGGGAADKYRLTVSPSAPTQERTEASNGNGAPSSSTPGDQDLPSITAPSSGRLH
jgi:DNA-binding transcriptional ArsR family regulator